VDAPLIGLARVLEFEYASILDPHAKPPANRKPPAIFNSFNQQPAVLPGQCDGPFAICSSREAFYDLRLAMRIHSAATILTERESVFQWSSAIEELMNAPTTPPYNELLMAI
jgi:hypothetical protein